MKTYNKYIIVLFSFLMASCEEDFLEVPPQDQLVDETYWSTEQNVETFAYGFYEEYFEGYGVGFAWGDYFSGEAFNDDFGPTNPSQFIRQVPTTDGGWSFNLVRKANIFIDRVQDVPMDEEAINHWSGIGRFFRAMEYHNLTKAFGDVPYFDMEITEDNIEALYKERDDRSFVMDKVLEDFQFAAENVRTMTDNDGQMVNRNVVLAFMSRVFLFEGTWQKYHLNNNAKAAEYLEASRWAADQVISSGVYSLGNYREVFNSLSLANNPEVILFREYEEGILTHSLHGYVNNEAQTGASKDAIESYLADDGLPISLSDQYQGDRGIENVMANRDPRMYETFVSDELRLNGVVPNYSSTGYAVHKFLNEDIMDEPIGTGQLSPTDAPVIRYGEVLVNYAEAVAELATIGGPELTQGDLDRSINVLRSRPGVDLPNLEVIGGEPAVNGNVYDDPERDADVPSMLWEIRRERRTELMMEGFRNEDLKRWMKLEYVDMVQNEDINRGAWIDKNDYENDLENLILTEGDQGYIIPATGESIREFTDPRVYLDPLPLDQITLYRDQGVELEQNPGW